MDFLQVRAQFRIVGAAWCLGSFPGAPSQCRWDDPARTCSLFWCEVHSFLFLPAAVWCLYNLEQNQNHLQLPLFEEAQESYQTCSLPTPVVGTSSIRTIAYTRSSSSSINDPLTGHDCLPINSVEKGVAPRCFLSSCSIIMQISCSRHYQMGWQS